ncbi:MAG: hypothetical protein E6J15_10280 [Chloroflexi bacterium]|nr:MAG: hypothetical protein E6J15_10280 [Chloroflexota bacterium]
MSAFILFVPWFVLAVTLLIYPKAVAWILGWRDRIGSGYGSWGPRGYVAFPRLLRLLGVFMLASGALVIYIAVAGS